jgi:tRNA-dihydrouridine synthase A
VHDQLAHVDGVMVGRQAYHHPWWLASWDACFFGEADRDLSCDQVEAEMVTYMERQTQAGVPWSMMARHMLGLRAGQVGARRWRRVWSDHRLKSLPPAQVAALAAEQLRLAEPV